VFAPQASTSYRDQGFGKWYRMEFTFKLLVLESRETAAPIANRCRSGFQDLDLGIMGKICGDGAD
jgi:hypothetical protein